MTGYLETAVFTASPAALHGMVADAAVRHASAAADRLAAGDREGGHLACSKATGCVAELLGGLDRGAAGGAAGEMNEVTDRLAGLFAFCLGKLSAADRTGEAAAAADAAKVLTVHAETWRELRAALGPDAPPAAAPESTSAAAPAAAGFGDGGPGASAGLSWAA